MTHEEKISFHKDVNEQIAITNTLIQKDSHDMFQNHLASLYELKQLINHYNDTFVEQNRLRYKHLFQVSDNVYLDKEQQHAILRDDTHNLIIAGAGSGKTEVLIRKIAYLVKRKENPISPKQILALAYQKKAAQEIEERLQKQYSIQCTVRTFHSLGKAIQHGNQEIVDDKKQTKLMHDLYTNTRSSDKSFQELVLAYATYSSDKKPQTQTDFKSTEEYYAYKRKQELVTLDGTRVKSEFERQVMNFFLTHTVNEKPIRIEYEPTTKWMKYQNDQGKTLHDIPDFFLPEYNMYVECWALDRNDTVPDWFEGENPTQRYKKTMNKKKKLFADQNKYKLTELFYKDFQNNTDFEQFLVKKLGKELRHTFPDREILISKMKPKEILTKYWEENNKKLEKIPKQIQKFINNAKIYGLSPDDIENKMLEKNWSRKQQAFTKLALTLYRQYETYMKKQNSMDFGDMINKATELLEKDPLHQSNKYDYILIDEYQDMNLQRYKLIKLLFKKNREAKLFAVGDDWQSIMAFSGSNLRYFTNFDTYFPNPTISHISTNYRSCTTIVQCGAHLINNNGTSQIPKNPSAQNRQNAEIKIIHISPSKNSDHGNEIKIKEWYYNKMASVCTNLIKTKLSSGYKPQDILLLTRYNKIDVLFDKLTSYCKRNGINVARGKKHIVRNKQFEDSVQAMTVHQSKGLQAPCVIILDVICGELGFPSLIEDPEIMEPAIDNTFDRIEEERRLFYVALTRAQKELFIFTRTDYESQFINEIEPYVTHDHRYYEV